MPKRELSCFLCRELLYEYVSDSIDNRRGEAVAYHLKECVDCKHDQESLKGAISYTRKLAAVEVRPEFYTEISNPVPVNRLVARRLGWRSWPDPLRWTVESLGFAAIIAVVVAVLGQQLYKTGGEKSPIATVEHPAETIDVAQLPDQTPNEFGEDEFTDHNDAEAGQVGASAPQPLEKRTATPEPDVKIVQAEQEIAQNNTQSQVAAGENIVSKSMNGFLYRTIFKVRDLETATAELVQKIESLGGKKAGEVPLGWKRPNGSYFHFSMPESNYVQLTEFLKKFSSSSVVKEKNPRVMPTGTIRMILEVDSSSVSVVLPPEAVVEPPETNPHEGEVEQPSNTPEMTAPPTASPEGNTAPPNEQE